MNALSLCVQGSPDILDVPLGVRRKGGASRVRRETGNSLEAGNWPSCQPGGTAPVTRVNTRDRVQALRTYFNSLGIHAYIIPSEDAHLSEYPSDYDKRRGFMTGFLGSAGFAVVTLTHQALWVDGRYFLEAEDTLDCHWTLMRRGEDGVPSMTEWLGEVLTQGSVVGASPFLVASAKWSDYVEELAEYRMFLTKVDRELVDTIWTFGREDQPNTDINTLPLTFAGRSWQDKVADMRTAMAEEDTDMMVVTSLDEVAWLFNLRANDIAYNPFFVSYAIVEPDRTRLYILDRMRKLKGAPSDDATTVTVAQHLNTWANGSCMGREGDCVEVMLYNPATVLADIRESAARRNKTWLSFACNYAIYSQIKKDKIHQANTPVAIAKSRKNAVEREGLKQAHVRDAVALVSFLATLESEVKAGKQWTEVSAAEELKKSRASQLYNRGVSFKSISSMGANGAIIHYRPSEATDKQITDREIYLLDSGGQYLDQLYNRGLSFKSVSGVGSNGAIIHYQPSPFTDKPITTTDMYLLDSGGQYLDGTTDVTRTFHFGTPTAYQKECYTRVLMGHINLFQAIWPKGLYGRELDAFARAPLWDAGLIYRHGTGHGIGMYLSVHEGPGTISRSITAINKDEPLDEFQFFSDEPGYYEDGEFGIRLENIVMVTNATTKYSFPGAQFLTFEHVTLVPYAPNLIDYSMLSERQYAYLNEYHRLCREVVGPILQQQGETTGYRWLMEKSAIVPLPAPRAVSGAATPTSSISIVLCATWFYFHYIESLVVRC